MGYMSNKGLADIAAFYVATADLRLCFVTAAPANAAEVADYNFLEDVTGDEVTTGTSRFDLLSLTAGEDDTADDANIDAADPGSLGTYTTGETIEGAYLYRFVSDDTDSPVIGWHELDTPYVTNGGALTITIDAEGLIVLASA